MLPIHTTDAAGLSKMVANAGVAPRKPKPLVEGTYGTLITQAKRNSISFPNSSGYICLGWALGGQHSRCRSLLQIRRAAHDQTRVWWEDYWYRNIHYKVTVELNLIWKAPLPSPDWKVSSISEMFLQVQIGLYRVWYGRRLLHIQSRSKVVDWINGYLLSVHNPEIVFLFLTAIHLSQHKNW